MDYMKKLGVAPMVMLKGLTGVYFKFADGLSSNGEPIELYFKPKFVRERYEVQPGLLEKIQWFELNVLWVGPTAFPEFKNGYKVSRDGGYITPENGKVQGFLIGKLKVPMGEFNDAIVEMHEWVTSVCPMIQNYLDTTLLPQVQGTTYQPLQVIFDFMLEKTKKESLLVEPKIYTYKEFVQYQVGIQGHSDKKYSMQTTLKNSHTDEDESGDDN